ncbi:MAG: hypothetical protein M1833_002110 [Piccolia ochrophora]|nr:MAG: hypothetical protein M1833_002110 [Piccolia ochrophora]
MEVAPLTQAHAHARSALFHTHSSELAVAIGEHAQAAGEFARAAEGSADAEVNDALRTLRLLEQHHQKLSRILEVGPSTQVGTDAPRTDDSGREEPSETSESSQPSSTPLSSKSTSPNRAAQQPPTLPLPHRTVPRDLTSSIASNLASARGIPSGQRRRGSPALPTLSAHHADGNIVKSPSKLRNAETTHVARAEAAANRSPYPSRTGVHSSVSAEGLSAGSSSVGDQRNLQGEKGVASSKNDDPFQRFYSTFEGLLSKISAPLAFAGLPLGVDETPSKQVAASHTEKDKEYERVTAEPDLNKIFSKAALNAVKEGGAHGFGAGGDSFYVVPSTGGTISYAGILSRAEQERRTRGEVKADPEVGELQDEPEFVDARETFQPPSPELKRTLTRIRKQKQQPQYTENRKTMEELHLENQALKQLSDTLSRRLHMWEVNSQSSSIALQQSLRAMQQSPPPSEVGKVSGDDASERIKELEEQLRAARTEVDQFGRENEKLKVVVGRYREKWEKLKEGARMRREAGRSDDVASASKGDP